MNSSILQLNLSQLTRAWEKSKFNNYSDRKKSQHIAKLTELHKLLTAEEISSLVASDIVQRSQIIDFFFKNLEFLENSTLNFIPYEIVECLKHALSEWVDGADSYIIVTSLINDLSSFSFDPTLAISNPMLDEVLLKKFGLSFNYKLIQINIPRFLVKDYLVNVILYHELGHFVDMHHNITPLCARILLQSIALKKLDAAQINDVKKYFPFLLNEMDEISALNLEPQQNFDKIIHHYEQLINHFCEYYCDLFACQYIENCANDYLKYITDNQMQYADTHPSTHNRSEIVEEFLTGNAGFVLRFLKGQTKQISGRDIKKRNKSISKDDFYNLIPVEIENQSELHSLFVIGWEIWINSKQPFIDNNGIKFSLTDDKVYTIINNLIEKSIANFYVKQSWLSAKQ